MAADDADDADDEDSKSLTKPKPRAKASRKKGSSSGYSPSGGGAKRAKIEVSPLNPEDPNVILCRGPER